MTIAAYFGMGLFICLGDATADRATVHGIFIY